jgi:hypothetical protein
LKGVPCQKKKSFTWVKIDCVLWSSCDYAARNGRSNQADALPAVQMRATNEKGRASLRDCSAWLNCVLTFMHLLSVALAAQSAWQIFFLPRRHSLPEGVVAARNLAVDRKRASRIKHHRLMLSYFETVGPLCTSCHESRILVSIRPI